jgi:hypothetical protein
MYIEGRCRHGDKHAYINKAQEGMSEGSKVYTGILYAVVEEYKKPKVQEFCT